MKKLINNLGDADVKTQWIVFGILLLISIAVIICMNHAGAIHFDKY